MFSLRRAPLPLVALWLSSVGALASPLAANAQDLGNPILRAVPKAVRTPFVAAPDAKTLSDVPYQVIPQSQLHKVDSFSVEKGTAGSRLATDPILFTTLYDHANGPRTVNGTPAAIDQLWCFPTTGFAPANNPNFVDIFAETTQATAPASINNTVDVYLGQTGQPSRISRLFFAGGMFNFQVFTGITRPGSFTITFYDGVDFDTAHAPSVARIARDTGGAMARYLFPATTTAVAFSIYFTDFMVPIVITDPRGRFGIEIAKADDPTNPNNTPVAIQWGTPAGYATGPNLTWEYANGSYANMLGLVTDGADSTFNQGLCTNMGLPMPTDRVLVNPPLNFLYQLQGTKGDGTAVTVGRLQGSVRRRGINIPGTGSNPESKPGFYRLDAYTHNTTTLVRSDYFYSQPSYDVNGGLTVDYAIDGYPAGTYDIIVSQQPILYFPPPAGTPPVFDLSLPDPTCYPFEDFLPFTASNVTVMGATTPPTADQTVNTVNARLERFGDITGSGTAGTYQPDGTVGLEDINLVIAQFGLAPPAGLDFVGPCDHMTTFGYPDNSVGLEEINSVIAAFGLGTPEPGPPYAPLPSTPFIRYQP